MTRAALSFLLLSLASCSSDATRSLSVRLAVQPGVRDGDAASMACYFAGIEGNGVKGGQSAKIPACMRFGATGPLQTFAEITSSGARLKAPVATRLKVHVFGVRTASACANLGAVGEMFADGKRPEIFEVGFTEAQLQNGGNIGVPVTYDSATAQDLGTCDAEVGDLLLTTVSPSEGIHRGGYDVALTGAGFEPGMTASVGNTPCTSVTWTSDTAATCRLPSVEPKVWEVSVRSPKGAKYTKPSAFGAYRTLYLSYFDNTVGYVKAYKEDPASGALTEQGVQPPSEANAVAGLEVSPSGKWLIARSASLAHYTAYLIDQQTGSLTQTASQSYSSLATHAVFHPGGAYLYVSLASGKVSYCPFNEADGLCVSPPADESWIAGGRSIGPMGIPAGGKYLFQYFGNPTSAVVKRMTLSGGGATLSNLTTEPDSLLTGYDSAFFNPILNYVFLHQSSGDEFVPYALELTTGSLAKILADFPDVSSAITDHAFTGSGDGLYVMSNSLVRRFAISGSAVGGAQETRGVSTVANDFPISVSQTKIAADTHGKRIYILSVSTLKTLASYDSFQETGVPQAGASALSSVNISPIAAASDLVLY